MTTEEFNTRIDAIKAEVFEHLELRLKEIDERNGVAAQQIIQRELVKAIDKAA